MDWLDRLYEVDADDHVIYGPVSQYFKPPARFKHCEEVLTARIPKSPEDGDGQAVDIYEVRLPATFYILRTVAGVNSVGDAKPAYEVSTGSGMGKLAIELAVAISEGMLSMKLLGEKQ